MSGSIEQEPCRPHQRYKHRYHLGKEDLRNSNVQCVDRIQQWEDNLAWVFSKYQAKSVSLISQPYSPPRFPSPVVYKSSLHHPMKSKEEATLNESAVSQKLFSVPRHFQAFCCYHKIAAKKHNLQSSLEILSTNTFFSLEPSKLFIEKYSFAKHNETTHSI